MLKRVVVECEKGFKAFGKNIRPGEVNELNIRQIFDLLKKPKLKVFEVDPFTGERIRLNKDNYSVKFIFNNKISSIVPNATVQADAEVSETVTPSVETLDTYEEDTVCNEVQESIEDETTAIEESVEAQPEETVETVSEPAEEDINDSTEIIEEIVTEEATVEDTADAVEVTEEIASEENNETIEEESSVEEEVETVTDNSNNYRHGKKNKPYYKNR